MQKLHSIQVLRGIAATAVVVCHAVHANVGAAGVDLFFVISGFIIGKVMVGKDPARFLLDRIWRIFPIYWIVAGIWFFVVTYAGRLDIERTVVSITLWPVYSHFMIPYLGQAWSLCYEMLFYYAAAAALITRKGGWIIACFLLFFAAALFFSTPLLGFLGFPLIFEFLFGLVIGKVPAPTARAAPLLLVAPLVMLLAPAASFNGHSFGVADHTTLLRVLLWGLPASLILYAALGLERFATFAPAVAVGDASYSIYLTHLFVLMFVSGWSAVPLALCVGLAVHRYVEVPILRLHPLRRRSTLYQANHAIPAVLSSPQGSVLDRT